MLLLTGTQRLHTWSTISETSGDITNIMLQLKFVVYDVRQGLVAE